MAIVQIILAIFSRAAGRVLDTAFAWATIVLFGRVPLRRPVRVWLPRSWNARRSTARGHAEENLAGDRGLHGRRQSESLPAVDGDLKAAELPLLLLQRRRHGLDVGAAHELPARH